MKFTLFAVLCLLGLALASVPSIEIKGKKLFYSNNGTEFYIRGIAYQPDYDGGAGSTSTATDYTDPLADVDSCKRDIPNLIQLRTNVVRTYQVNPNSSHDECMNALADAGIYVISDLGTSSEAIEQNDPMWNAELFDRYASVIDAFQGYSNMIGFFIGNEVSNKVNNTDSMAFVKAATRDMKSYIKEKGYRKSLAIGYAADDDQSIRVDIANYLVCGSPETSIDMYGYNIYEWCGKSSFKTSGYEARTEQFKDYPIPAFFSEYGCNSAPGPRTFDDVPVLYGPDMNQVWSGGIIFMYFQAPNKFGLVSQDGSSVSKLPDFTNLQSQIQKATPTGVNLSDYTVSTTVGISCPTVGADWMAASVLPPAINSDMCSCMYDSLTYVPSRGLSSKQIADTFDYLGEKGATDGVSGNGTSGVYGAYSGCNSKQRLAWAMNEYYKKHGSQASACDLSGIATTKSATSATGSCASRLHAAGTAGTGVASGSLVTGTSGAHSSTGTGSSILFQSSYFGVLQSSPYVFVGVATGVLMIAL